MLLIDLILDILKNSQTPLQQKEIVEKAISHKGYTSCEELQRVKVKSSAIARALSKFSTGTNPQIGILSEGKDKISFKRYFLRNSHRDSETTIFSEIDLHPILVEFVNHRFNLFCKTINALKSVNTKNKIGKWTNPDIVGINPIIFSFNELFQQEIQKQGTFSNKVAEFYSFELKIKVDKSNITEAYFQAVSNSSWANYGYLVVEDYENNLLFLDNLSRLNNAYGIGLIKLNTKDPTKSEIIISARYNENVDINFMNFLSTYNKDYYNFIREITLMLENRRINNAFFDKCNRKNNSYRQFLINSQK